MNTSLLSESGPLRRALFTHILAAACAALFSALPAPAPAEIFVTNRDTDTVGKYATTGEAANPSLITGLSYPTDIAVSGAHLYVTNYDTGVIGKYTRAGATVNASLITGFTAPFGITVAGGFLYVADAVDGTIGKYNLNGTVVNASLITGLGSSPYGLAVSGTDLFVANYANGTIGKYTTSGATVDANFITGLGSPVRIALYGGNLFVTTQGGTIGVYDAASGATVDAALVTDLGTPVGIAVFQDGLSLFVAIKDFNSVGQYSTSSGVGDSYVITGLASPFGLAVVPDLLQLDAAVSRKTHGGVGDFDINLPLTGAPGVECRSTAGSHTLVFSFNNNVVSGSASVTAGVGSVSGSPTFSDNTMTVLLTGVADVQKITVTLSSVTDSFAQVLPTKAVRMNMLIGDTTGNKTVNASDIGQTKSRSGMAATSTNFRSDVTVSGAINASDIGLVKSRSGASVP